MGKVSQRGKLVRENFMRLHNEGFTILEIANKYGISRFVIYKYLDEIAEKNGVSRESLLQIPHKPHEISVPNGGKPYILDTTEVKNLCFNVKSKVETLLSNIEAAAKGE